MMGRWWTNGVPSAGLFTGAAAWAVSTQLNYALVTWICARGLGWVTPGLTALLMAVSLGGGVLSWRVWTSAAPAPLPDSSVARPRRFLAGMGVLGAALFTLVIATQGAAGLILQGCER